MRVPARFAVGAATHTGRVRRTNEDDFILLMPVESDTGIAAVADGMGGSTGGAEASRTAIRALCEVFMAAPSNGAALGDSMRQGFAAACQRVFQTSLESPSLRGMGTTLTAVAVAGDEVALGHIGDSRCYRLRDGVLEQLTTDHVVAGDSQLTRCVGGGKGVEQADVRVVAVRAGDRFLLATDGLWSALHLEELSRAITAQAPQPAAEELVATAHARGGRDNCTAVIVSVGTPTAAVTEVALPAEEVHLSPALAVRRGLRRVRWPYWTLVVSLLLLALAVAKARYGVDLLRALSGGE